MKNAQKIIDAWMNIPESVKERKASENDLDRFESGYGTIPKEFRWFLLNCGGGPIGSDLIDGIDELVDSHIKFQKESESEGGWKSKGFVIGWDGAGNPILIEENGKVVVEDHNFGGIHELSSSFEALLIERL